MLLEELDSHEQTLAILLLHVLGELQCVPRLGSIRSQCVRIEGMRVPPLTASFTIL